MNERMTLVLSQSPDIFPRQAVIEGETYSVRSAFAGDALDRCDRLSQLLTDLIYNDAVTVDILNEIGFTKDDANDLGIIGLQGIEK